MKWIKKIDFLYSSSNMGIAMLRTGAAAALTAALLVRRNLDAELEMLGQIGAPGFSPTTPIASVEGWFRLLRENPLAGLVRLNFFDLVNFVLVGVFFCVLTLLLFRVHKSTACLAGVLCLLGIGWDLITNQAVAIYSLSRHYALADFETQQSLLAAGQKLLDMHYSNTFHGAGMYPSYLLTLAAGLILSILMLNGAQFPRWTAVCGLFANGLGLFYYVLLAIRPALTFIPVSLSAVFLLIWYLLIGIRLGRLAAEKDAIRNSNIWQVDLPQPADR